MVVATAMMLMMTVAATATPAAAQLNYPGLEPGISLMQVYPTSPAVWEIGLQSSADFLASCGDPAGPVTVQMTASDGTPVGGSFLVNHRYSGPSSVFSWTSFAAAALGSHMPGLDVGDVVTVSMGAGCNSYDLTVMTPPDRGANITIDHDLNVAVGNPQAFGCGYDASDPSGGFVGVFDMRVFDAEGNEIGLGGDVDDASDVQAWLDQLSDELADHVPALDPGERIYLVWSGECDYPYSSQIAYAGPPLVGSLNPETGASVPRSVMVLAGLSVATAAMVGVRRLRFASN